MKLSHRQPLLVAISVLGLGFAAACNVAPGQMDQGDEGSAVLDIASFDPANFNAGNTFEYLVNPAFQTCLLHTKFGVCSETL